MGKTQYPHLVSVGIDQYPHLGDIKCYFHRNVILHIKNLVSGGIDQYPHLGDRKCCY